MAYTIIGSGPQARTSQRHQASTAAEALKVRHALAEFCGHAVVLDTDGHEVSTGTLRAAEAAEREVARQEPERSDT